MSQAATSPEKTAAAGFGEPWRQAGFLTAVVLTVWIAILHVFNLCRAGPLWRDEIGTVDFAAMPTVGDIWHNLRYDTFPPLFVAVTRLWTLAGLKSDFDYRLLGFLMGMGTLAALWFCARKLGGKTPLLCLAFYMANPLAIRVGDSLRPYGLGIAMVLLTAALIWEFADKPGKGTWLRAALAAVLSVQCLYQSAFFIAAFSCGAWAVALSRKDWKTAGQTGGIGLAAALSLLPYWGIIQKSQEAFGIARWPIHFSSILASFDKAMQTAGGWMTLLWLILCLAGLAAAVFMRRRWNVVYCATALVAGALFYLGFLRAMDLAPRVWYFLILMAVAALMVDSILGTLEAGRWQLGRAVLSFVLVAAATPACQAAAGLRQSNIDLVAARLKESAAPDDMIVVTQWYMGVSLQRYLDTNRWTTLPPIEELGIHRYDLIKQAMMMTNPIGPLLGEVRSTLRAGHRLWVVGGFEEMADDKPPEVYPPYNGHRDEAEGAYCLSWLRQFTYFVRHHVPEGAVLEIPVPGDQPVTPTERVSLTVLHGWKD